MSNDTKFGLVVGLNRPPKRPSWPPKRSPSHLPGERDPVAQRDIERLFASKDRIAKFLPRVTAYCTASSYRMEGLMKFLQSRASTRTAAPQLFDEWYALFLVVNVVYTPRIRTLESMRHRRRRPV